MSIEALAAIGPQSTPKVPAPFEIGTGTPAVSEASPAAEAFRSVMDNVHADVSKYASDPQVGNGLKADPVDAAKQELRPDSAPSGANEGNNVLRKSFDHAIFVTLVSQVVSGLSQTTSTLIRQQ